jgi:malonyl CoA-acyl carrier protein transacylase
VEFLDNARAVLETDADLVRRTDLTAATWKQKRLENVAAADTVAEDIVSGYDMLAARVEALAPPDDALASVLDDVKAIISIGVAASRLVEKGMRSGEEEKVDRGMALLHGHDAERQRLRTQSMTLKLEYAER